MEKKNINHYVNDLVTFCSLIIRNNKIIVFNVVVIRFVLLSLNNIKRIIMYVVLSIFTFY